MKKQSLKVLMLTMILALIFAFAFACTPSEPEVEDEVVIDPAVAATCTEAGKTEGSHWKISGEVVVAQVEIPALGHDLEKVFDGAQHWEECQREGCDYATEKVDHTIATEYSHDATQHWQECSDCDHTTEKADHTFSEWTADSTGASDPMLDSSESRTCSVCGRKETRFTVATGYTIAEGNYVSSIARAEELVLTTDPEKPGAMDLTAYFQLPAATAETPTAIRVLFISVRDTTYDKDVLFEATLPAGQQTFKVTADLSSLFIPLAQDAYDLAVEVDGNRQIIALAPETTFVPYANFKNAAEFMYTVSSSLKFSRDANAIVSTWDYSKVSMSLDAEGKPILTVSGKAFINGADADNTTKERTFSIWFINEAAGLVGTQIALTTENLSTSDDTRDFTFNIDLSSLESNGDWYKLTIGIDEGAGMVAKTQTSANTTTLPEGITVSGDGTENQFGDPNTVTGTITGVSYRIVTAWGQVHVRA